MKKFVTGMHGRWVCTAPFDTIVKSDVDYTADSILSIEQAEANGLKPLETVYKAQHMTEDDMRDDIKAGVEILILRNSGGSVLHIPTDRISRAPDISGKYYTGKVLTINLGMMPDDLPLEVFIEELRNFAISRIGVDGKVQLLPSTADKIVGFDEHVLKESDRRTRTLLNSTADGQLLECKRSFIRLQQELEETKKCLALYI